MAEEENKPAEAEPKTEEKPKAAKKGKLAAIRVRGEVNVTGKKKALMISLGIGRKNNCVVLDDTLSIRGMLENVNHQITWGEIDDATAKELKDKRGKEGKKTFCLSPPRGGFERKGIKAPYSIGGALGYRGKEIIKLIKRMI